MQLTGEQRVAVPRQRVWDALNDPDVLRQCIPGCQSLEKEAEDRFAAVAEVKIGPIGARFKGGVTLSDRDAPNGYTISGQGNGGIAGSARGSAKVQLSDDGSGTRIAYSVDAEVGGRMAQLGGPIIDATARQMAAKFFTKFGEVVGGEAPEPVAGTVTLVPAVAPVAAVAAASTSTAAFPWAWTVVVALAVIGGFLLGRSDAGDLWVVAMIVLAIGAAAAGFEAGRRGAGQ